MKKWILILASIFFILETKGQGSELSIGPTGGPVFYLGPGGKPDRSLNYGGYVQFYFVKKGPVSIGLQTGYVSIRNTSITRFDHETTSYEFYTPVQLLGKLTSPTGWFAEIGLGTYYTGYSGMGGLAASLLPGFHIRLTDHISIPLKIRLDFLQERKSYNQFWDGVVNISLNPGIAFYFK